MVGTRAATATGRRVDRPELKLRAAGTSSRPASRKQVDRLHRIAFTRNSVRHRPGPVMAQSALTALLATQTARDSVSRTSSTSNTPEAPAPKLHIKHRRGCRAGMTAQHPSRRSKSADAALIGRGQPAQPPSGAAGLSVRSTTTARLPGCNEQRMHRGNVVEVKTVASSVSPAAGIPATPSSVPCVAPQAGVQIGKRSCRHSWKPGGLW